MAKTIRGKMLQKVIEMTEGARNKAHGDPVEQHTCAAAFWNNYIKSKNGEPLNASDVCQMMILLKISRQLNGDPTHGDHYADEAGYASISQECVARENSK